MADENEEKVPFDGAYLSLRDAVILLVERAGNIEKLRTEAMHGRTAYWFSIAALFISFCSLVVAVAKLFQKI